MKIKYIFNALFLLLFSCDVETSKKKILPENTGKQSEIILVIEDSDWKGVSGDVLRKTFEFEMDEPLSRKAFNLVQINPSEFSVF